jgi:signal transduction histidine kinase
MAARSLASAAQRGVAVSRRIAKIAEVQQAVNAPIDLSAVVGSSLPRLRQLVGGRVTVTADCPPGLVGIAEEEQVVSALENLCENAAEAMGRAGTIHIAVAPVASSGGRFVEIAVADDGPGIPDHLLGSVFDPFVTGRPDSGTGLGLYLIQEYLYSAGGTVEVESSPQGATFRLRFPAP